LREVSAHSEHHIDIPLRHRVPVDEALRNFATDSHGTLFCLLGAYGAGKTVALEYLTLAMATKYLRGEVTRIPLLVRLRHVRGSGTFSHNLVAYIDREFGINVDVTTLKRLIAAGRVLLILDGLDEKEDVSKQRFSRARLHEVFDFLSQHGKLVLSARTEYFKNQLEEWQIIMRTHRPAVLKMEEHVIVSTDGRSTIAYLEPLPKRVIRHYIQMRFAEDSEAISAKIAKIYDLSDLVRRPVLLQMICDTIPFLEDVGRPLFPVEVYETYIRRQLQVDYISGRMCVSERRRMDALSRLAEKMLLTQRYKLHHSELGQILAVSEDETLDDFLTTSFLVRDGTGNYEFSHRSFMEFFGAYLMFESLRDYNANTELWTNLGCVTEEQFRFLDQLTLAAWEARRGDDSVGLVHRPITTEEYAAFIKATRYKAVHPISDDHGFASVSWYDAVAFCQWSNRRMPLAADVVGMIRSELTCPFPALKQDSLFYPAQPGWERPIECRDGTVVVRGSREWTILRCQVEASWINMGSLRPPTYQISGSAAAKINAMFRCCGYAVA
jgi:hypothetical protein